MRGAEENAADDRRDPKTAVLADRIEDEDAEREFFGKRRDDDGERRSGDVNGG